MFNFLLYPNNKLDGNYTIINFIIILLIIISFSFILISIPLFIILIFRYYKTPTYVTKRHYPNIYNKYKKAHNKFYENNIKIDIPVIEYILKSSNDIKGLLKSYKKLTFEKEYYKLIISNFATDLKLVDDIVFSFNKNITDKDTEILIKYMRKFRNVWNKTYDKMLYVSGSLGTIERYRMYYVQSRIIKEYIDNCKDYDLSNKKLKKIMDDIIKIYEMMNPHDE